MGENIPKAPLITLSHVAPSLESLNKENVTAPTILHIDRSFQRKESILSSQISIFIEKTKQNIPDGGWGWLVVVACFVINMMSDGVSFTFGLLYIEFLHEFKASKSATSWVGSLFMALPLLAGKFELIYKLICKLANSTTPKS